MSPESSDKRHLPKRHPRRRVSISLGTKHTFLGGNFVVANTINGGVNQNNYITIAADESYQVSGESPYCGLKSYTNKDSESYAGRDEEVEKTVRLLAMSGAQPSLLFVVGASGSGKSSFVQAGLLSNLQKLYEEDNYIVRPFAVIRPGINPCDEFYEHIFQKWSIKPPKKCNITQSIKIISENTDDSSINIILIDQFEEVWTQSNPEQRHELLEALQTLPSFEKWRTHIIITLRSDFIHKLYPYKKLYDLATKSCVVELRPMTSSELKSAIERPLHMRYPDKSKRWEERLLTELTQVAAGHDEALPLLQVLLNQIWQTKKLWISEPKYFDQSISNHAEEIYKRYSFVQQAEILNIILVLVKVGDEPRHDVRQRRTIDELCGISAEKRQ